MKRRNRSQFFLTVLFLLFSVSLFPFAAEVDEVPVMTSDTTPSGKAEASTVYSGSYEAWRAFDGDDQSASGWTHWISEYSPDFSDPQWLSYTFVAPKYITRYYILPQYNSLKDRSPKNWQLQGWDGSSWVTLDTRNNIRIDIEWNANGLYFQVANPGAYYKYRLYVTAVNGSDVVSIRKLKLLAPLDSIPVMTSNTLPLGTASASTVYSSSYQAWKAFDGDDESAAGWTHWISAYNQDFSDPQWLSYDFGSSRTIIGYYILPQYNSLKDRSPKTWQLQGWNGSSWITVDTQSNIRIDIEWYYAGLYFDVAYPGAYSKYRLYVTAVNGSDVVSIRQLKLFE